MGCGMKKNVPSDLGEQQFDANQAAERPTVFCREEAGP